MYKEVLNGGYVKLISHMGNSDDIVRDARMSHDNRDKPIVDKEKAERFIGRLYRDRHTSPFEGVVFKFEVKAPIFVARQWFRHRTWSYNEVSGRYVELPEDFYIPDENKIGHQHPTNKQMRLFDNEKEISPLSYYSDIDRYKEACEISFITYRELLSKGWPRELARCVLPLATYTRFIGTVDLHNLLHFLRLRLAEDAQYEIRVYAEAILEIIEPIVPEVIKLFNENRT